MNYEFDTSEGAGREAVAVWLRSVRNDVAVRFMECERSLPLLGIETRAGVAPRSAYEALFDATERYVLVGDWMGLQRVVRSLHEVAADRGAAAGRIVSLLKVYRDSLWDAFERDPGPGLTPKILSSLDDRLRDFEAACLADRVDRGASASLRLLQGDLRPSDAQSTRLALACTDPDPETAIPAVAQLLAVNVPFDRFALVLPDGCGEVRCYETEVGLAATAIDRAQINVRPGEVLHTVDTGMTAAWCDGAHRLGGAAPFGLELAGCRAGVWVPLVGRTGLLGIGRISAVPVSDRDLSELLWAATIMAPAARAWTERLRLQTPPEPPLPADEERLSAPVFVPEEERTETYEPLIVGDELTLPELPDGPEILEIPALTQAVAEDPELADESPAPEAPEGPEAPTSILEPMPMFVLPQLPEVPDELPPPVMPRRRHGDLRSTEHLHGPPLIDRRSQRGSYRWVAVAAGMLIGVLALGAALATVLSAGNESRAGQQPDAASPARAASDDFGTGGDSHPLSDFGFLTIKTAPAGVPVRVNGSVVGLSPLDWVQVPAGKVQVTVDQKGLKPWIKTLALDDSEHRKLRIELLSERHVPAQVASNDDVGVFLGQTGL